ncbi:unnamed protein product [Periconia digitata]|uniref:Uncharacterized protein n=1 Tax=Periconia digitata TaxID=1303443 RepID=A0A9W4U5J6_9PLEO|nr:unnamed protein product [Periconia digitata]
MTVHDYIHLYNLDPEESYLSHSPGLDVSWRTIPLKNTPKTTLNHKSQYPHPPPTTVPHFL